MLACLVAWVSSCERSYEQLRVIWNQYNPHVSQYVEKIVGELKLKRPGTFCDDEEKFTAVSELVTKLQTDLMTFEQQLLHLVEISRPRLSDQVGLMAVVGPTSVCFFRLLLPTPVYA